MKLNERASELKARAEKVSNIKEALALAQDLALLACDLAVELDATKAKVATLEHAMALMARARQA